MTARIDEVCVTAPNCDQGAMHFPSSRLEGMGSLIGNDVVFLEDEVSEPPSSPRRFGQPVVAGSRRTAMDRELMDG